MLIGRRLVLIQYKTSYLNLKAIYLNIMNIMSDLNGDDLLKVFNDLNINLGNLNLNSVRGWFDTDDKDMKNLLVWLCSSLSPKNYLCPLEDGEYQALKMPLSGEELDKEMQLLEKKYPGIFDVDQNALDIELLKDEIDILLENDKDLDELLTIEESLQNNLSDELNEQTKLEIKSASKLKSTQECCNHLAEELDTINDKIHNQLITCGERLFTIEYGSHPLFINNMDIKGCRDKFDTLNSALIRDLENCTSSNLSNTINTTSFNLTGLNNLFNNDLHILSDRILNSQQNYMACKIEVERLMAISRYMDKTNIDDILPLKISESFDDFKAKEEQKKLMLGIIDTITTKLTNQQISDVKLKFVQRELDMHQVRLKDLSDIDDALLQLLSIYLSLFLIYQIEEKEIDRSNYFLKKLIQYVKKDLQCCILRTENMKKLIEISVENYNGNNSLLTETIIKMLSNDGDEFNDCNLSKAFKVVMDLKNEMDSLEMKLFCPRFSNHRSVADDLKNNIDILKSFLISGPTHKIVLIPSEFHSLLLMVQEILKMQKNSIKSSLEIAATTKKIPNKWMNLRRQLWMYFYADSKKLNTCIQQVEAELVETRLS